MDKSVQAEVFNNFYSGKIRDVSETENGMILTIDMSEYNEPHSSFFRCELINCREFSLKFSRMRVLTDLNQLRDYEIEMLDTQLTNGKLKVNCLVNKINKANLLIETETIKVYGELNREIPLLELSIIGGLCSDGVGIDFYIGNTINETYYTERYVKFNEELQGYLRNKEQYVQRYKEKKPKEAFDLLIGLDQYGDKLFSAPEINQLINICDGLLGKYKTDHINNQKIRYFAEKLKELCEEAKLKGKLIIAIGD
ncbi:hypothetical protein [Priestia abyssalis]|uniref:hypothetical protein n=1 Tax=Priestia abyssalis TaxID=1221450 RepID=UPI001F370B81|nr:hypothetical protein [Priestia abyssalis]